MVTVTIPEREWAALEEFITASRRLPHDVAGAVRAAASVEEQRVVTFGSPDAVRALIEAITAHTVTWDVPWAVQLNRILPRLYRALDSAGE